MSGVTSGAQLSEEKAQAMVQMVSTTIASGLGSKPAPIGFQPLGADVSLEDIHSGDIPQTIGDLEELISYTYDLTATRALELGIPVIGSGSGGFDRRVVILEWTQYKPLFDDKHIEFRYGYVIRFCLTVSKWDAKAKITLPFLTAQAELGSIEASWLMQVRGLNGPKIDEVILPPQDLKVDTFVIAKQSLEKAIKAVNDPTTRFKPGVLLSRIDPTSAEVAYWLSAVRAFGLYSIRKGRTGAAAKARLASEDPAANDALTEVYGSLGLLDPTQTPSTAARDRAGLILHGISADV
jgi:hypothetical protein